VSAPAGEDDTPVSGVPPAARVPKTKATPDTYWLLQGTTLLLFDALGGLYVRGEENVPVAGPVLLVSNHVSYLDPVAIGDASPRRVVFMAKHELFQVRALGFLLRGVDSFPVRRGEPDRQAFKNTLAMLEEGRVVCIFPEGTRHMGEGLGEAEPGAALFAQRTGCPVVPVFVSGTNRMLDHRGRLHRARVVVSFGSPFTLPKGGRDRAGHDLMAAIARTRDAMADAPARRIRPHWIRKPREGSRTQRV
jgi:1-acyl-sn-glycerol-3-phosphate acyltransferase